MSFPSCRLASRSHSDFVRELSHHAVCLLLLFGCSRNQSLLDKDCLCKVADLPISGTQFAALGRRLRGFDGSSADAVRLTIGVVYALLPLRRSKKECSSR